MNPDNPVVRLCASGIEAEGKGEPRCALELFMEAWNAATDDYERCIAAHYVARHQDSLTGTLLWNQRSLDHAKGVDDVRVAGFYSSLYLNLGKANEDLGNRDEALSSYHLAEAHLADTPEGPYRELVQRGIRQGIERLGTRF